MSAIRIEGLRKEFGKGVVAVDDCTLEIQEGEFFVLVGPSGSGKTTVLRMIAGLEEPNAGTIHFNADDVTRMRPRDRDIAMVFQDYALYPQMKVRDNIAFGLKRRKTPKREIAERVEELSRLLELEGLLDRLPGQLSGGQRQRVALGRAIARSPRAFLMDEPLSNLDANLRATMRTVLVQLRERLQTTTVYVTHDQIEAMTLGDRVGIMRDGVLQQVGAPREIYERPANVFVASFVGSPTMNLVEGRVEDGRVRIGDAAVAVPPAVRALESSRKPVVVGLRPGDLEDARFAGDTGLPTTVGVVAVRNDLGGQIELLFHISGDASVTSPVLMTGDDANLARRDLVGAQGGRILTALVNTGSAARVGDRVDIAVDPARLYFFDSETGDLIQGAEGSSGREGRPELALGGSEAGGRARTGAPAEEDSQKGTRHG